MADLTSTQYYHLLDKYITAFKSLHKQPENHPQIIILEKIIEIGLKVEQESETNKLESYASQIEAHSKAIGPICDIPSFQANNKVRQYALPHISDNNDLLLALIFLKHLHNYENLVYQGVITSVFTVPFIIRGINAHKPWKRAQAKVLKKRIETFCAAKSINFQVINSHLNCDDETFVSKIFCFLKSTDKKTTEEVDIDYEALKKSAYVASITAKDHFENYATNLNLLFEAMTQLKDFEKKSQSETLNTKLVNMLNPHSTSRKIKKLEQKVIDIERKLNTPLDKSQNSYHAELLNTKIKAESTYKKILYASNAKLTLNSKQEPDPSQVNIMALKSATISNSAVNCMTFFKDKIPDVSDVEDFLLEEQNYGTALKIAGVSLGVAAGLYMLS